MQKTLHRVMISVAALFMSAFFFTAHAATSVSWNSPANGSTFNVGAMVMPDGTASGIGQAGGGLDLMLVLDSSGSMRITQTVDGVSKTRREWQQDAAIALVNNLPANNTSVGIVEFDGDANTVRQLSPLLTETAQIIAAINSVDASGSTNIGSGIVAARVELTGGNHTAGRSQAMVVFSDGSSSGSPASDAANALSAGITVHSVAMPGANIGTMQSIASAGGGTYIDASTAQGLQDLLAIFSGVDGGTSLVGIDRVDITMPDNTFIGSISVDAFGNFKTPEWLIKLGANEFVATAYATDGTSASAALTLIGVDNGGPVNNVPEPSVLGLLAIGLVGMISARRRKV